MNDLVFWNALALFPKFGPKRFKKIYSYFPNMKEAFHASFNQLKEAGLEEEIISEFQEKRKEIEPEKEWEKLEKEGIKILTIKDKNYPAHLKEIYNSPAFLYYKGELQKDEYSLSIVGTRKMTSYGKQAVLEIAGHLAQNGLTIVSGLALGIDALAHQAALDVKARTIAVLGGGIDRRTLYPSRNLGLAEKIVGQGGAIISEYPIGTLPLKQNFPYRNRIISGLSLGVLIIEAPQDSGALITARYALEQNREIFALPGSIYSPASLGPNNLVKMGAKLITSASDILEELNLLQAISFIEAKKIVPDTKEEALILEHLSREPLHIDKIVELTKLDTATVNSVLVMMEMKGKVRDLGGMSYIVSR
jgi:DNA processing protein